MNGWLVVGACVLASLGTLAVFGLIAWLAYRWAVRRGTYQ